MKTLALFALMTAIAPSTLAETEPARTNIEVEIVLDTASLTTQKEAREAYAALMTQARDACRVPEGLKALGDSIDRQCVGEVIEATLKTVDSPLLTLASREFAADQYAALER